MTELKKGDVVELKSGGPKMTIQDIGDYTPTGPEEGAFCVWFEKDKRQDGVFDVLMLRKPIVPRPFVV